MISHIKRTEQRIENMCGGQGHVVIERLLTENELKDKCGLFARVTLKPGCTLGYHTHNGETETYYILSGKGLYNDNGSRVSVTAGDLLFCREGGGHGLDNTGENDLVFMALIIRA